MFLLFAHCGLKVFNKSEVEIAETSIRDLYMDIALTSYHACILI